MIINSIEFKNWQGYFGTQKFSFDGTGERNSGFILGDNTVGKTAFWEGVMFALYDHVPRRKNPNKFKPYIAKNSSQHPLMNIDLFGKKGASFSVTLAFTHEGKKYTLQRGYCPKYENRPVNSESDLKPDSFLSNDSISGPGKYIEDDKRWINENILPERLVKFFLFDGEKLEEYEELMEKEEDLQLRRDIEDIIRTPILKNGEKQFTRMKHKYKSDLSAEKMEKAKNKSEIAKRKTIEKEIKDLQEARNTNKKEINSYEEKIAEIEEWLLNNDTVRDAVIQLSAAKEKQDMNKKTIEGLREDIGREVGESWKIIISNQVNSSIESLEEIREIQNHTIQEIGVLKEERKELDLRLKGDPCKTCERERTKPSNEEKLDIEEQLTDLDKDLRKKEEHSKFPTAEEYYLQREALTKLKTTKENLNLLLEKEENLMISLTTKERIKEEVNTANSQITEEREAEVKEKTTRMTELKMNKQSALTSKGGIDTKFEEKQKEFDKYINLEEISDKDTVKVRRLAKSIKLTEMLSEIFSNTLEEYRETMRKEVERRASSTFMSISNNAEHYLGLKITKNYKVSILNKKNKLDAGSQAQSLVMAYSIIDALSSCSGFEFPMIIDTPGRGLARKNMDAVFNYFTKSEKQIIFLPNDRELDPQVAINRYRDTVASIYQLEKIGKDRTASELLVDNLVIK